MSMRILLTGSSGMLGTRLFEKLQSIYEVVGLDKRKNGWNESLNEKTIKVDLLKKNDLTRIPKQLDLIIHLAANARVYELVKNPKLAIENIVSTFNILEFARKNDINKIVFSSSREIYGSSSNSCLIAENEVDIRKCENSYSASKISDEALIYSYGKTYGLDFAVIRFSNIYGMYDKSDRVIPLWIREALKNEPLNVYQESKILDFIYIDDAITGLIEVTGRFYDIRGETLNIATGKGVRLMHIAYKIRDLVGSESKIVIKANRPGEVSRFQADISKAQKLLEFEPKVNIDEGLAKTVEWYKKFYKEKS
jgi:nucleoside-diphosphate-sugar epimerase